MCPLNYKQYPNHIDSKLLRLYVLSDLLSAFSEYLISTPLHGTIHYRHNYSKLINSYMNDVNKINHSHETITV